MPVPGFEDFMLPLLELAGDGREHTLAEARSIISSRFHLSEEDHLGVNEKALYAVKRIDSDFFVDE